MPKHSIHVYGKKNSAVICFTQFTRKPLHFIKATTAYTYIHTCMYAYHAYQRQQYQSINLYRLFSYAQAQ